MRPASQYPYFAIPATGSARTGSGLAGATAGSAPRAPFLALAHRGGSLLAGNVGRENTLAAFAAAVALGYRYLETDVHATADGHLVAFHDERLDRVSDATGMIAELPLAQVRSASVGGEQVPTLDEVLDQFPAVRLNVDIKAPGATEPLWRTIEAHQAHDRVCVGSFSTARLRHFTRLSRGRVATAIGRIGVARAALAGWSSRLVPAAGQVFQVPETFEVAGREVRIVSPAFIERAHRNGQLVHVWTIDEPEVMERLIDWGVDGLVSDRIDVLRRVLEERGLWQSGSE